MHYACLCVWNSVNKVEIGWIMLSFRLFSSLRLIDQDATGVKYWPVHPSSDHESLWPYFLGRISNDEFFKAASCRIHTHTPTNDNKHYTKMSWWRINHQNNLNNIKMKKQRQSRHLIVWIFIFCNCSFFPGQDADSVFVLRIRYLEDTTFKPVINDVILFLSTKRNYDLVDSICWLSSFHKADICNDRCLMPFCCKWWTMMFR